MDYLIGIDLGSSSIKGCLTDTGGRNLGSFTGTYPTLRPHPGWAEQDPGDWWCGALKIISELLSASGINPNDVAGVGVTGFVPGLCPVDDAGNVIRPAIMHTDLRAAGYLKRANELFDGISLGFLLAKLLWYAKAEPENYRKTSLVLNPHSYLVYKLTGEAVCDYDTATITGGLFDTEKLDWDRDACREAEIRSDMLPRPMPANGIAGRVTAKAAAASGLVEGTPVIAGTGDSMAALLGHGAHNAGDMMIYLGSSATRIYLEGSISGFLEGPHFGVNKAGFIGRIISSGDSMEHYRKFLGGLSWDELNSGADEIGPGSEKLIVIPHLKQKGKDESTFLARESIFGLVETHSAYHIYHALLEGIAFNLRIGFKNIRNKVGRIILCGGGAGSDIFCRIISEVLNFPVYRCRDGSGSSGIALLAGTGCGLFSDFSSASGSWFEFSEPIVPGAENARVYDEYFNFYLKLIKNLEKEYMVLDSLS